MAWRWAGDPERGEVIGVDIGADDVVYVDCIRTAIVVITDTFMSSLSS